MEYLISYCHSTLRRLVEPIQDDPIRKCGLDIYSKLRDNPEELITLADKKLHVFPFKDVDGCWRRLYADASLAEAVKLVLRNASTTSSGSTGWLDEVVKILDMAVIMTGAPLREDIFEEFFSKLGDGLVGLPTEGEKKSNRPCSFDSSLYRQPELSCPVRKSRMSPSAFEKHLSQAVPVVITGAIEGWPAFHERPWKSPEYLLSKTLGGGRLVPVELGRSYTDENWGQTIITFRDFMDKYLLARDGEKLGYLAQHELFSQIPALRRDIYVPDFCYTSPPPPAPGTLLHCKDIKELAEPILNAWLGPAGTISPLHTDPYHNILCQVVGKKYVRLYAPDQSAKLYPRGVEGAGIDMSNTSRVPVEEVEMGGIVMDDDHEFPLFADAEYVETVLHEGECLYIPVGWWHYVRSLTPSFSVSCWWN